VGRKRVEASQPCPHCGDTSVRRYGTNRGRQRWHCRECDRTFGATLGTPMYRLHTEPAEIARTLLILMRRGSLRGAEDISGHKWETIRTWLLRASEHAEAISEVLVKDLALEEVEVDAFWSFIGNAVRALQTGQVRHRNWATVRSRRAAESSGAA
jgi:transposase-like protein